jgi:hypothetical protein
MARHIRTKQDRREAAWEQTLRERSLRDLRRTIRREQAKRSAALAKSAARAKVANKPGDVRRSHRYV